MASRRYSSLLDNVLLAQRSDGVFKTRHPHLLAEALQRWFLWRLDRPRTGAVAALRTPSGDLVIITKSGWVTWYTDARDEAGRYLRVLVDYPIAAFVFEPSAAPELPPWLQRPGDMAPAQLVDHLCDMTDVPVPPATPQTSPLVPFTLARGDHPPDWATVAYQSSDPYEVANWLVRIGFTLDEGYQPDELHTFLGVVDHEEAYGYVLHDGQVVVSHGDTFIALLDTLAEVSR